MALVRNWRLMKSRGPVGEVVDICKKLDLRGCKKISITFDPFRKETKHIRDFNHMIFSFYATKTNPNIVIKTDVVCDRSDPIVNIDLSNGEKLLINCTHLTLVEIFKILDEYSTPLAPVEEAVVSTKKTKLKLGKKK